MVNLGNKIVQVDSTEILTKESEEMMTNSVAVFFLSKK